MLDAQEWATIEAGLRQRVRALNASSPTSTRERRIVDAGVVPERVIDTAEYHEPAMHGVRPPGDVWIGISGLDLVRDARRATSRCSRTTCARPAATPTPPPPGARSPPSSTSRPPTRRGRSTTSRRCCALALEAAAPADGRTPRSRCSPTASDNAAYYEHEWAAKALGIPLLEPEELAARDDIDVVYRRTNADRLDTAVGRMLLEPVRAGRIGVVNAFGTGVADDKLTHAYVEDMIRFYLDEEPLLPSVETFDLGRPEILERALDVFDELVIKPRGGYGGEGVAILPHAEPWDVEAVREAVRERPDGVRGPAHGDALLPPDRRSTASSPRATSTCARTSSSAATSEARVAPGGLTRVAFDEGALVVNSSQNGGAKDTWVLAG